MSDSPLSDAQAQRLIKLYSEAEAELLQEINRLLVGKPKDYSLAWQRTILQRTQQIKADLLKGSRTWCQEAIPASYMKGVEWADKDPLSGQMVQAGFGSIHQQAVEVLADNAYSRLEDVANVVGRRTNDIYRQISLEAVKGSVVGYKTTAQAARDIRKDLAEHGITGFVDKAGHKWNMRRYATVLAQETTNGAFRQGTINRLQEKGHDLVRISAHTGSCKLCQPYQGQTFSLTGNDKEFPPLSSAKGLFHVGCLHVISLAPEEKDRFIGRLQGKEGADVRAAEIKRLAEKAGWKEASDISGALIVSPKLGPKVEFSESFLSIPDSGKFDIKAEHQAMEATLEANARLWADKSKEVRYLAARDGQDLSKLPDKIRMGVIYDDTAEYYGRGIADDKGHSLKTWWNPYTKPDRNANIKDHEDVYRSDAIATLSHELHHAYGHSNELDLMSDAGGLLSHLKLGMKYAGPGVRSEIENLSNRIYWKNEKDYQRDAAATLRILINQDEETLKKYMVDNGIVNDESKFDYFRFQDIKEQANSVKLPQKNIKPTNSAAGASIMWNMARER